MTSQLPSPIIGHEQALRLLTAAVRSKRLAHAYLFAGPEGIGKRLVATRWATAINCETPPSAGFGGCATVGSVGSGSPGSVCRSCAMAAAGSHPDMTVIEPDGLFIKIEQIRAMQAALGLTAWSGSRKIVLIDRADRLNQEAANCLLKTLEEPPPASLLILISSSSDDLLPTLRSRCQVVRFFPLDPDRLTSWLADEQHWSPADAELVGAVAGGCLGKALAADPSALRDERDQIDQWISASCLARTGTDQALSHLTEGAEAASQTPEQFERTVRWLLLWLQDAVRLTIHQGAAAPTPRLSSAQRAASLLPIATCCELAAQLHWTWRASFRNINRQLLLEHWLIALREACLEAPRRIRQQEPAAS
ncbi:MAG TPA: DNA polymerase III subunit delta' [Nitrospiria bacterium]|nr:DNA polymerase III subunit delta' [Nitrospiria bacterium]